MTTPVPSWRMFRLVFIIFLLCLVATAQQCPLDSDVEKVCTSCTNRVEGWVINCANAELSQFPAIDANANISILNLGFNRLTEIPVDQISSLAITTLRLESNQLTSTNFLVQDGRLASTLQELHLDSNSGVSLRSAHFTSLSSLRTLSVERNGLTNLGFLRNDANPVHLQTLEILRAGNNQLTVTDLKVFENKTSLKSLYLFDNSIDGTEFLQTQSLHRLEHLELQRNQIGVLPAEHFRYLTSLTEVNVRSNQLAVLDIKVLTSLPSLKRFDWALNPADCACSFAWLNTWQQDYPGVTLVSPSNLDSCPYPAGVCPTGFPLSSTTSATFIVTPRPTSIIFQSLTPISTRTSSVNSPPPTQRSTLLPTTTTSAALPQSLIIIIAVVTVVLVIAIVLAVVCLVWFRSRKAMNVPFKPPPSHESLSPQRVSMDAQFKMSTRSHEYAYIDETRRNGNNINRPLPESPMDNHGYLIPTSQQVPALQADKKEEIRNNNGNVISSKPLAENNEQQMDDSANKENDNREEETAYEIIPLQVDNSSYIDLPSLIEVDYATPNKLTQEGEYQKLSNQNSVRHYQEIPPVQNTRREDSQKHEQFS